MDSLATLYRELDFQGGDLLRATADPPSHLSQENWIEKGEWLASAQRAKADRVFFVDNNPVIVFAECGQEVAEKVKAFNRAWSLARPRILFLASPGEITVYDLAQKPVDEKDDNSWEELRDLKVLQDLSEVASQLQAFHRDNIESGRVFGDQRFGNLNDRADKALIRDLKTVRRALMQDGLSGEKLRYAHSLIGRSIFIRYLEDRGILDEDYFLSVARQTQGWTGLLREPPQGLDLTEIPTFFPKVLQNKDFTYALFQRLSKDFNGDMFPDVETEYEIVQQNHLHRIQGLLYGDTQDQKRLFFYAYRFDIVPLDLISSIYEEFYHSSAEDEKTIAETKKKKKKKKASSKARDNGAYYTPPALAEFVLSRALTPRALRKHPRVLDPACGSGIFLVEAFRRMVRYERHKKQERLTFDELRGILRDQIAGIEVEEEASRITAFSLYLAMLHYLDPPAIREHIRQGNRLPHLLASDKKDKKDKNTSSDCLHCILTANAFDVAFIASTPHWQDRFGDKCADIVVGNPPWGNLSAAEKTEMVSWCEENERSIGHDEPSQAFLLRVVDFLRPNGVAGMFVSAGILFKHGERSGAFRKDWLGKVKLREVFNFTHVRHTFFAGDSPFVSVVFEKGKQEDLAVEHWSAKQLADVEKTQAVLLSLHDLSILRDVDLTSPATWKVPLYGQFGDGQFIRQLSRHPKLKGLVNDDASGFGFKVGKQDKNAGFSGLDQVDHFNFTRYDDLLFNTPPTKAERPRNIELYKGPRILFRESPRQKADVPSEKGWIIARYETKDFVFCQSVIGLQLTDPSESRYKTLLGILWSSLSRYYCFMAGGKWGVWHDTITYRDELLELPVVLDESHPATKRVVRIVDNLRGYHPQIQDLLQPDGIPEATIRRTRRQWEQQLDEAVFDLYDLTEEQRDLIRDCCEVTLPFFYKPLDSVGAEFAVPDDGDLRWMEQYTRIFARRWNAYLPDDQEMRADLHIGAHGNMVAVEFYPADKGDSWDLTPKDDWQYVLEQLAENLPQPMGTSRIVLDGLAYVVSDDAIIVIKRNIKRLWTRSIAREDAGSTLTKRMIATMHGEGRQQ